MHAAADEGTLENALALQPAEEHWDNAFRGLLLSQRTGDQTLCEPPSGDTEHSTMIPDQKKRKSSEPKPYTVPTKAESC